MMIQLYKPLKVFLTYKITAAENVIMIKLKGTQHNKRLGSRNDQIRDTNKGLL